jgi:S1-C subfamily serine protease
MSSALTNLSDALVAAVAAASQSVVAVEGSRRLPASGVIWGDNIVVTVDHALKREEGLTVVLPGGESVPVTLAGRDPGTDLAILKAEASLPAAKPASAPAAQPGAIVLAVGRSVESGAHSAMGIVSAVRGPWRTWRGGRIERYVRLDLAMYPGLSGSIVADAAGSLVGIATSGLTRIAGIAIPVETVDRVVDEVLTKGYVSRAYLGVGVQPIVQLGYGGGLIVVSLEPDSPAAKGGLLLGDILLAVGGHEVHGIDDLQEALQTRKAGDLVPVRLSRGGVEQNVEVALGERARRTE